MTYNEFIQNIINTRGQWNIPEGEYYEMHHILPRCLGGDCDYPKYGHFRKRSHHKNCIWLYAREHYIAHKLLAIENPNNQKLVNAWSMMAFPKGCTKRNFELSPEEYEAIIIAQRKANSGKNNAMYGKKSWAHGLTKGTDKRLAEAAEKQKQTKKAMHEAGLLVAWNKGLTKDIDPRVAMKPEAIEKQRESLKKVPHTAEWNKHVSESQTGMHIYNNGEKEIHIKSTVPPEGFIPGPLPNNSWTTSKGRHWYNNGVIDVMDYTCPDGFVPGRLSNRYYNKDGNKRS